MNILNKIAKPMISAAAASLLTVTLATAQTPEEKGMEIAIAADKADTGWGDSTVDMRMIMTNANGQTTTREIRLRNLEVIGDGLGDKSLSIFDTPRDVKGTAFLSHTKVLEADDQWLLLPALGRVKRISSANKSGPFMGSEFAFEDILSPEIPKYTYKYLRDEDCAEFECYVMERVPTYENSGYTKQVVWVDKEAHRYMKIDFYDRKNSHLKTLTFSNYNQYLDKYWRAAKFEMVNHQSGKSTVLDYDNYEFATGLTDRDFTSNRLKTIR